MAMPLRMFWSFQRQIDRLRAEDELQLFQASSVANVQGEAAGKIIAKYVARLQERIGTPAYSEAVFDEAKFQEFAARFGQKVE